MGKSGAVFPPLRLMRELTDKYQGIWDYFEKVREASMPKDLASEYKYNSYLARMTMFQILKLDEITDVKLKERVQGDAETLAPLASWRRFKQVYQFNENLKNMLFLQAEDFDEELEIPSSILLQLPYPSIFVECEFEMDMYVEPMGFFTHYELVTLEDGTLRYMLVITFLPSNGVPFPVDIILDEKSNLKDEFDSMEDFYKGFFQRSTGFTDEQIKNNPEIRKSYNEFIALKMKLFKTAVKRAVVLLLYLCAKNAEVSENPEQAKIYKPSTPGSKEKFNNLRKWDVGEKTGQAIKHMEINFMKKDENEVDVDCHIDMESKQGTSMRPHTRRAHFHHYWTGSRSEPDKRKLELKWLAPMNVNMQGIDDIPITRSDIVIS